MITFEQNLSRLLSLRKDAQHLINTYADVQNIQHLRVLQDKTEQLKNMHLEQEQQKQRHAQDLEVLNRQLKSQAQKTEAINLELKLNEQDQQRQLGKMEEMERLLYEKDTLIFNLEQEKLQILQRHKKEIDNLNLTHNQELYILRKKK